MLDLDDPQSQFIFAIARESDAILSLAKKMTLVDSAEKQHQLNRVLVHISAMRKIAYEGWGASAKKSAAIDQLQQSMEALAAIPSRNNFADDWKGKRCTVCGGEIEDLDGYPDMVFCCTCLTPSDSGRQAVVREFGLWCI